MKKKTPSSTSGLLIPDLSSEKLWRYMSFARFVWLLHKKLLWLSRSDLLGDPWEIALAGEQLAHVVATQPIHSVFSRERRETALERSERIIKTWRRSTFVNCWSSSAHESHALWRVYCRSTEGVAIQTTFAKLRDSVAPDGSLLRVAYDIPGKRKVTPTLTDLVSKKRLMFEYEHEVRVVRHFDTNPPAELLGLPLVWDADKNVESVRVHPEADDSFMETVRAVVQKFAPTLLDHVAWSDMETPPPF